MSKYIATYEALCPGESVPTSDPRRPIIINEMRRVCRAKSVADAVGVIEWWACWPNPQHATAEEFVVAARAAMKDQP